MSARPLRMVAVALVTVSVVVLGWLWATGGDESGSSGASANPARSGTASSEDPADTASGGRESGERSGRRSEPVATPPQERDPRPRARARASAFLKETGRVLRTGDDADTLAATATGPALDAARASAAEFADNGWRQVGHPKLVDATVVFYRPDASPPRMRIVACVDSSAVDVVDASGESVRRGGYAARSRMRFDLVREHDDWLVQRQGFPDDPDCTSR